MTQSRFLMLVGLPASGKSTFAEELMDGREDIVYLSSDLIRRDLFGKACHQDHEGAVFNEMALRTRKALQERKHVIHDAVNLNRKNRLRLLAQLPKNVHKTVVYMATDYPEIRRQNGERERSVPEPAIETLYKQMQIPIYSEGWDNITFVYDDLTLEEDFPKQFTDAVRAEVLLNRDGLRMMDFFASYFPPFSRIYDMAQDSKHHSFSVSRHTYYVYKHVLDHYETTDEKEKELMLWTALLHDTGKYNTKRFVDRKGKPARYASFIGHEAVSSQLAVNLLKKIGFDEPFIHTVSTLIQFHMYLLNDRANLQHLKDAVGEDLYGKLEFLREADSLAH